VKAKRSSNNTGNDNRKLEAKATPDTRAGLIQSEEIHFTIKDLAEFSGIKPHTIRIWEQRFTFLSPQRTQTSRRFYTGQQVIFFLQVCLLKQDGYRMTHIAKMSSEERNGIIAVISGPQKYVRVIYELISCMIIANTFRFNNILDACVREWGIHETLHCVILPFSERTCLFENPGKKTYRLNLFLVMECIKQKIYLGIEGAGEISREKPTVLLFPAAVGDLLLLYIHYLIKKEGFRTIYLGEYSSFRELSLICNKKKPGFIISDLTEINRLTDWVEFIGQVSADLPRSHFITTGRPLNFDKRVHNYHHIENPADIVSLLNSLQE
jgi:DNA-binding transcriptional MerR regulator